jgi:hypothetical protein
MGALGWLGDRLPGCVFYRTLKPFHRVRDKLDMLKLDRFLALLHGGIIYRTNDERATLVINSR